MTLTVLFFPTFCIDSATHQRILNLQQTNNGPEDLTALGINPCNESGIGMPCWKARGVSQA